MFSQGCDCLVDRLARLVGSLYAQLNRFLGAMEVEPANGSQSRINRNVRRVAGQPGARDAILHYIEGVHHHRRETRAASLSEELSLERAFGAEEGADPVGRLRQFDRLIVTGIGAVADDGDAAAKLIGIEVDGYDHA